MTRFTERAEPVGVTSADRATWLRARHTMLTASDVASVFGRNPYASALDLYVRKISAPTETPMTIKDAAWWGAKLEQPILSAVAEYYDWAFEPGGELLRSRAHPHLGATLDAEINRGDGWEVMEGKTTKIPKGWDEESGDLPTHVLIQAQAQLLVTSAPRCTVFALLQGSRPCMIEIHPDADFHAVIVEETERFMERLSRLDPPDTDHTEASRRALERLYPTGDGGVVMLPDCAVDWTRELAALAAQQKALERRADELKNMLRASIGDATWGVLPEAVDGRRYWRWQTQERKGHVVAPSSSRVLLGMKNGPDTANALPAPAQRPALESVLRASVAANEEKAATPQRRRRARR